ncbi:NRDE-2, necessary for RNA interference-domain-containing protein [Podospora aff. communis PSN243]|uniref:NRDE-2, necessary for RNA interference-domain-containing protein n=1 Tax=Podospora aff. communis PSN243 TaxID=3040156 RepID=A0AAV9H5M7_9PEZI|nr:NRDE-2, necessary for RNA interference-domain-containing protein [Podospora aff. communis PSN243]
MSSRGAEKRRPVPRFASFKPKPDTPAEVEPEPKSGRRSEGEPLGKDTIPRRPHRQHESRRERASARDGDRRHRHERRSPDRGDRSREGSGEPRRDEVKGAAPGSSNNVYFFDKRGDPLILRYGSNDRAKVPSYHRFGAGRLMGAHGILTIHHDRSRPEFTIRGRHRDVGSIFRDKKALSALVTTASGRPDKHLGPSQPTTIQPIALDDDFIPLDTSRKRKRGEVEPSSLPDYRNIYRKSSDDTSGFESETSLTDEEVDMEMSTAKKRSIQLSRQVKAQPEDIDSWVQLVELQDALFRENQATPANPTAEEAKGLAELRVSLYEEALPHASQPQDRERLLLGLMREGTRAWDPKNLARRWEEVNKKHSDSFMLWRERLNGTANGTSEDPKMLITERLELLRRKLQSLTLRDGEDQQADELCSQLIYVFLRLTRFLVESGYTELAVAAWQAELEMTFCRPDRLFEAEEDAAVSSFSDFWESEAPRMGEEGAKGWRHFEDLGGVTDPPDPKPQMPSEPPITRDKFKAWAAVELQKAAESHAPARTFDEGTEDDPFRVVMFSDIREHLVWFPTKALNRVGPELLDAFLLFCGLPTARLSSGLIDDARNDPFVAGRSETFEFDLSGASLDAPEGSKKWPQFRHQGGNLVISQEVLFSGAAWFRYLDNWHCLGQPDFQISWVLGTLKQLVKGCGQKMLAEYYLAASLADTPDSARKVAKGLLKQYSSNLRLYSAYALVENANGNLEIAEKVLSAATSQEFPAPIAAQILFNAWTWIYLEANQKQTALNRLCLSVDRNLGTSPPTPSALLKARAHFSSTRDYALSSKDLETAVQHAESLALLDYLTVEASAEATSETQGNITAALATIEHFSADLAYRGLATSPHHERLLQTISHLLYHHSTHGPYRSSYIRDQLLRFIHLFPQNTLFLSLFAAFQPTIRIDDPVRATLQSHSLRPPHDSLSTRRFAIAHEARTGTAHSTRAAFDDALDDIACRGNADMWIRYVRFCFSRKELRGMAKGVFYRALGACPMAKVVYMEAYRTLVRDMGSAELRGVFEAMVSKGVRVHVDLEGWLERWERETEGQG